MTMTSFITLFEGCATETHRNKSTALYYSLFNKTKHDMNSYKSHNALFFNYVNFISISQKQFGHFFICSICRIVYLKTQVQDTILHGTFALQCAHANDSDNINQS